MVVADGKHSEGEKSLRAGEEGSTRRVEVGFS